MRIRLKKDAVGGGTLTYVRDDGTTTWMPITPFFAQHDLMHYAVETTMGFRRAFMGLVAGGRDLQDFEKDAKDWLPPEAIIVETIVSQLLYERAGSASPEEFQTAIGAACAGLGLPLQPMTRAQVDAARSSFEELFSRWQLLPAGGTLELSWPGAN